MYIMMCTQRDFACSIHDRGGTGEVAAAERLYIYMYIILCTREASRRLYCIIIIVIIIIIVKVQATARSENEKRKKTTLYLIGFTKQRGGGLRRHRGFMFLEWDK